MAEIIITEFIDQSAVDDLSADFDVVYDPQLVDQPERLLSLVGEAPALIVRNRTQVRGALLEAAMTYAAEQTIEALFLEVAEDNLAARHLYQKFGYAIVGRRSKYYRRRYGPSVDALTLRCKLTSAGLYEN